MERIVDSTTKPCLCLSCPVHLSCNIVSLTWYFSGADTGASQLLSLLSVSFSLLFMFKTIIRILFLGPTFYFFYFYFFLHFFKFYFLTLQYCIGFAIYQHESATGIQVFPILNPPPSSLPVSSLWDPHFRNHNPDGKYSQSVSNTPVSCLPFPPFHPVLQTL